MNKITSLQNSKVPVQIVLAQKELTVKDISRIKTGAVVMMDRNVGEPADLVASGKVIAKGEVVVIDDTLGLRITEITDEE